LKTQHSADITERRIASIITGKFLNGQTAVKKICKTRTSECGVLDSEKKGRIYGPNTSGPR
jgi:hypothetical protein